MNNFYGSDPDEMPPYGWNGKTIPYERGIRAPQSRGLTPQQQFDLGHRLLEKIPPFNPEMSHEAQLLLEFFGVDPSRFFIEKPRQPETKQVQK